MTLSLDDFDLKLLMEVQRDAQIPQNELGARVNLSTAAVNRRLRRMSDEGVIRNYAAIVAPEKVGYPLTIIATVEVESEQIDLLDSMKRTFAQCPEIQQCYYVAGEWDFLLILTVRKMEEYTVSAGGLEVFHWPDDGSVEAARVVVYVLPRAHWNWKP